MSALAQRQMTLSCHQCGIKKAFEIFVSLPTGSGVFICVGGVCCSKSLDPEWCTMCTSFTQISCGKSDLT